MSQSRATPEPRFARTAAIIADPSRARMLALLLGGEARAAGELARAVAITPQTASAHLAQLLDANLVQVRTQGRHRYFTLADADVAHMLEALSLVTERDAVRARWDAPACKPLKYARSCYCHLAGELGVRQFDSLMQQRVLVRAADGAIALGEAAAAWLAAAGFADDSITAVQQSATGKRFAYGCIDWSERREHLAGALATRLLAHYLDRGWLRKTTTQRALVPTPPGATTLARLFALPALPA
jgi:DNA-binding transcriptional ArsR family regulator